MVRIAGQKQRPTTETFGGRRGRGEELCGGSIRRTRSKQDRGRSSVEKCLEVIARSMSVRLVIKRKPSQAELSRPVGLHGCEPFWEQPNRPAGRVQPFVEYARHGGKTKVTAQLIQRRRDVRIDQPPIDAPHGRAFEPDGPSRQVQARNACRRLKL